METRASEIVQDDLSMLDCFRRREREAGPKEATVPREWMAAATNLVRWSEFDKGGHFAALEHPEAMIKDIRAFFHEDVPKHAK